MIFALKIIMLWNNYGGYNDDDDDEEVVATIRRPQMQWNAYDYHTENEEIEDEMSKTADSDYKEKGKADERDACGASGVLNYSSGVTMLTPLFTKREKNY